MMYLVIHLISVGLLLVRKYCERVCNQSRLAAAEFLLDSIEIRDNFRHSVSLLYFNEVCETIVH